MVGSMISLPLGHYPIFEVTRQTRDDEPQYRSEAHRFHESSAHTQTMFFALDGGVSIHEREAP